MSLLDDVSIVVTPNGYKAGELYAVVPVPTEGTELVTNGDFATDSDWTLSQTTIANDKATVNSTSAYGIKLTQATTIGLNKTYKILFTVADVGANINFKIGFGNLNNGVYSDLITTAGTYEIYLTQTDALAPSQILILTWSIAVQTFSITNISVKEVITASADMDVTRTTAATRVDEAGLVNYAEVLSETEEVTNGEFATDSDWTKGTGITISGGSANFTSNANSSLTQSGVVSLGKSYKATFTVRNYVSGAIDINLGGSTRQGNISANGTYDFYITVPSGNILYFQEDFSNGFVGSVDNVSVKELIRDNVPRIDYTGGGCPHILAEPQRTNVIEYSEDFSNSYWAKTNANVESNAAVSPDGTQNADKLNFTTSSGEIVKGMAFVSGQTYTMSFYAKTESGTLDFIYGNMDYFTISGTATDEWQRFVITQTLPTTTRFPKIQTTEIGSLLLWGWQVEQGSFPTSYIPTSGSTVTRNQDIFTRDGIGSLINSTEGVLFVEFKTLTETGVFRQFNLSKDNSNRIYITKRGDSGNLEFRMENPSGNLNFSFSENTTNDFVKVAFRYGLNNFAVFIDGVNKNVTATGNVFASGTLNTLEFDSPLGQPFFGKVKQLQVYKTALTDAQLTSLTS